MKIGDHIDEKEFVLESMPHAPQEVICKKAAPDLYLLLDPDIPNWIIVNNIGREIVYLCNGKRTVDEIIEILCEKYNEQYEESVINVLAFVNQLKRKYFVQEKPRRPPAALNKESDYLKEIWIHVTNRCNLRCIHCHLSSGLPLEAEMTTEEIHRVVCEAEELGAKTIHISGGEPLIRKDILTILENISQHTSSVILLTNGTLITDEIAKKLKDYAVAVQVSLDGAREETNDLIRGKDAYKKTISGLQNLVKAGVLSRIAMTLIRQNIDEMDDMVQLVKKLGLSHLHFPLLQIKGRAKENQSSVELQQEDVVKILKKMQEIPEKENIEVSAADALRKEVEIRAKHDTCGAGITTISVAADGNVYPCAGLHVEEFCAGSIREQKLKDIWKTSKVFKRLKSFSVLDIPECRACDLKFICGGGCHVDRYSAFGQLDKPTPRCKANQEIYWHLLFRKVGEIQLCL